MGAVVLIFGLPMIIASWLMSSTVMAHLANVPLLFVIVAVVSLAGWPVLISLASIFAAPPAGMGRGEAVVKGWFSGAVLTTLIVLMLLSMGDSATHPGPNPTMGFLLAGLSLSMLVSYGIWGAFASIVSPNQLHNRALMTGIFLFAVGAGLVHWINAENYCPNCNNSGVKLSDSNMDDALACQHRGGTYTDEGHDFHFTCNSGKSVKKR